MMLDEVLKDRGAVATLGDLRCDINQFISKIIYYAA